jgi:site-specific recombinase XerD
MMLEEFQRRNYAQSTVRIYLRIVQEFAEYFHQPPDKLGPDHLLQFQAHLFQDRKLDAGTVQQYVAALRCFFVKTLKRFYLAEHIPMPKRNRKLPEI